MIALYIIITIMLIFLLAKISKKEKPKTLIPSDTKVEAILDKLNKDILKLISYMKDKYDEKCDADTLKVGDNCLSQKTNFYIKEILKRLNYNPDNLIEHMPDRLNSLTAYNDNKGETIGICLRYEENGVIKFHDYNTIMFVLLHEFSHTLNKSYDHDEDFWTVFGYVINDAKEIGIYKPVDYFSNNEIYCNLSIEKIKNLERNNNINGEKFEGINITYNPYYDENKSTSIREIKLPLS